MNHNIFHYQYLRISGLFRHSAKFHPPRPQKQNLSYFFPVKLYTPLLLCKAICSKTMLQIRNWWSCPHQNKQIAQLFCCHEGGVGKGKRRSIGLLSLTSGHLETRCLRMMGDYVKGDHLFVCKIFGQVQWLNLGKDSTDKRKMHGWKKTSSNTRWGETCSLICNLIWLLNNIRMRIVEAAPVETCFL